MHAGDAGLEALIARREQVVRRLQEILIERLHLGQAPDEIDPDAPLLGGGLDLDSVDALELIVGTEQEFGLRIEDEAAGRLALRSLNTLADLILERAERSGPGDR